MHRKTNVPREETERNDPKKDFSKPGMRESPRGAVLKIQLVGSQRDEGDVRELTLKEGHETNMHFFDQPVDKLRIKLVAVSDEAQMTEKEARDIVQMHLWSCENVLEDHSWMEKEKQLGETEERIREALRTLPLDSEIIRLSTRGQTVRMREVIKFLSEYGIYDSVRKCAREMLERTE